MRANKLTPGHNLMWEASRMMLPEHVGILQQHQKEFQEKEKPEIDEQQTEIFSQKLSDAHQFGCDVRLTLFHPYQNKCREGRVRKFNPETEQLQLDAAEEWIRLADILDVEVI